MVVYFYGIIIVGGRTDVRLFVCLHIYVHPFPNGHFCRICDDSFLQIIL